MGIVLADYPLMYSLTMVQVTLIEQKRDLNYFLLSVLFEKVRYI